MTTKSRTKSKTVEVESAEVVKSAEVIPDAISVYQEAAIEAVAHGHAIVSGLDIVFKGAIGILSLYYRLRGGSNG